MGRQLKDRTGERFISREGYEFVIVEYNGNNDLWVEFQDEHKARVHTGYGACKSGEIKNPYYPSVFGVGCLGLSSNGSRPITTIDGKPTREYTLWKRMLERCYSGKHTTYANVTVCDCWLAYANFLEDLPLIDDYEMWLNNPNERIALDKDLKQVGVENKVYSLETVKFITISENSVEMIERTKYTRNHDYKKIKVICLETKQVFSSIKDASEWCGKEGVDKCCKGKQKTCGGYRWQYLDDYKRDLRKESDINNSKLVA